MARQATKLSAQILEEATCWFVDFNEGEVDTVRREDFNGWLRRSPEHVRAYLQITAFWEDARTFEKRPNLDIDALVARACAEHNVYALDAGAAPTGLKVSDISAEAGTRPRRQGSFAGSTGLAIPSPTSFPSATVPRFLGLAAATMLVLLGSIGAWYVTQRNTYAAAVGEQRSFSLEDGSSVELNSRSRLKVRFKDSERAVELLAGQALFRVAKDPVRPFIVTIGNTRVRAVGTQFDVYWKKSATVVTVLEGTVAVAPENEEKRAARQGEALLLTAGQQVSISPAAPLVSKPANIAVATAWTEKKLVFESTPLREVVEEFNRYNRRQLVIRDPELYDFHVSGVFPSTDSSRMVEFLRQRFGVTMNRSGDEITISRRASPVT